MESGQCCGRFGSSLPAPRHGGGCTSGWRDCPAGLPTYAEQLPDAPGTGRAGKPWDPLRISHCATPSRRNVLRTVLGEHSKTSAIRRRLAPLPHPPDRLQLPGLELTGRAQGLALLPGPFQPLPGPSLDGLDLLVGHPLRRTWSGSGRRRPRGCPRWPPGSGSTGPQPPPGTGSSPSGHEGRRCS